MLRTAALLPLAIVAVLAFLAVTPQATEAGEVCWQTKGEVCLTLTPDPDTNPVNTDHTVTLSATINGDPWDDSGLEAGFFVLAGPNAGESSVQLLDSVTGQATFTYTGAGGAGTDDIVGFICETDFCDNLVTCLEEDPTCIDTIIQDCQPPEIQNGPARILRSVVFCVGPVEAVKNWEDPTPTPSGTPTLAPATQAPSPTPAQLPDTGADPDDSGTPWTLGVLLAIGAAMLAVFGSTLVLSRRRIQ